MEIKYNSIKELVDACQKENMSLCDLVINDQVERSDLGYEEIFNMMKENFLVMKASVEKGMEPNIKSVSGLTGGDAAKLNQYLKNDDQLISASFTKLLMRSVAVSECNAAMGKIVAAPTAGSCGIIPSAIITLQEEKGLSDEVCIKSLFTASAVGLVISNNATLSGAKGGCQAECGSASAMAAAAIVELSNGDINMISNAIAISLKNILGLVCDPVAGLVEIPCIKRNASGVMNAYVASNMALSGIESKIPADEVISAMYEVGNLMSSSLKETAEGGLANTKTAKRLFKQVFNKEQQ